MKASHPCSPSPSSLRVLTHRRFIASWSRWLIAGVLAWAMTTTVTRVQALIPGGPEIAVFQGTATGTELFDNTSSVSLGTVNTDSSASQTITIKNTASGDSLTGLSLSKIGDADFTLSSLGVTSLAPGATASFTITFIPSAAGARTATVKIVSNDSNENPFEIAVTGTGVLVSNPGGREKTVPLVTSSTYTFSLADWGFTDVGDTPPNTFTAVKLTSLPSPGTLSVDGSPVTLPGTVVSTQPGPAGATWTERTSTGKTDWGCIASSADGTKLVAGEYNGNLWLSSNGGATWTEQTGNGKPTSGQRWLSIASSDDGSRLAAGSQTGIWLSADSGTTWTLQTGISVTPSSFSSTAIASSSDGSKIVVVPADGHIWTYDVNSSPSWTERLNSPLGADSEYGNCVACSNDGQVIVAGINNSNLWRSTNGGINWTEIKTGSSGITTPPDVQAWMSVTASSDGSKLAALGLFGDIWTSADSGSSWTKRSGGSTGLSEGQSWFAITSSDDGSRLAACVGLGAGNIWTSADSGATWTERTGAGEGRAFRSIASSADGLKLAFIAQDDNAPGGLWTSAGTPAPVITYQSTASAGTDSFTFQVQDSGSSNNEDTSANTFTFNVTLPPPPTVTGISPVSGTTAGGTSVTLTGTGFTGATGVTIGGVAATAVTVVSDTSLTCTTPAGTAGTASVLVTTPSGTNAANTLYTYLALPTITLVTPSVGSTVGGTSVTITGTNLGSVTSITVGGTAITTFTAQTDTSITFTVPAGTGGLTDVVATSPDGVGTATNAYGYTDYTVSTTGGTITVTDLRNAGDALSITQPSAGTIQFSAASRYFSVDGSAPVVTSSGAVTIGPATLINVTVSGSITVDGTTVNTGGAGASLNAKTGITISAGVNTGGGALQMVADTDNDGTGTLTVSAAAMGSWTQQPKLTDSGGAASDRFGFSVALSSDGNTAIFGAYWDKVGTNANQGSAVVFTRTGSVWTQQAKLTDSVGAANDWFGFSVALSSDGNTALVGATGYTVGVNTFQGSALVFTRTGSSWAQQEKLTDSGGGRFDQMGNSVALSSDGNTALVGEYGDQVGTNSNQGSALVFTRTGSAWTRQSKLTDSGGAAGDQFGSSVALSSDGNTALVGASADTVGVNTFQGSALVFTRTGSVWAQQAKVTDSGGAWGDSLGSSVALSSDGNTALVGASADTVGVNTFQGSAVVFTRSGSAWTQQSKLADSGGAANDQFGYSVALSSDGSTALVGARQDTVGTNASQGSAVVFTRTGSVWTQQPKLTDSDGAVEDYLGGSVALSGDGNTVIVGAYGDQVGANAQQGSGSVFTLGAAVGGGSVNASSISAVAADMDIQGPITGSSSVQLLSSNSRAINVGTNTAGQLGLTDAELDRITVSTLQIGNNASGSITVSAPISPLNYTTLALGQNATFAAAGGFTSDVTSASVYEKLAVTGTMTITAGATFATNAASGYVWNGTDTFTFLANDATDAITGTFTGPTLTNFLGSTLTATQSYTGATGNDFVILVTSPEIAVEGNATDIANGDTTPAPTDGTDFGSVLVNGGTVARTFTIKNTGPSDLNLSSNPKVAVSSTDFSVTTQPTSPVVANTGSTTFVITFDPSAEGARTATVTIVNDDSDEGTYTFAIKGTGLVVAPVPFTIGGLPKHIVTNEGATDATGAADGTQFDILGRGGYLAANGTLGVPGSLKIGVGGVTEVPNNFQAYWKDDGTGLKRLVRSGDVAPGTGGALFNSIPTIPVPGLNPQGVVTLLSALRIGSGGVTSADDSAMWSEVGGNGLQLLMRENDPVPGISGGLVASFGFGCYATANTGDKTGEAVFAIKMKGATLDSVLLRHSITGPSSASVSIVAREKAAAPGAGGELFGPLHSTLGAATRMDTLGNIVFEGQIRPSGRYGIWYQPVGGSLSKVFIAEEAAPGTGGATFSTFEMPSMGSNGTFAFVGYLNADGDNTANDKNNGVWRGTVAGGINPIIRRGDAALPGMVAGSKVGHLWSGWLNQNNRGAWRGWIDTAGDGVSAFPDDTYGIYTDAGGTMRLLLKVNDIAPGTGGATLASVDHPVISGATVGNEHVAFIGTLSGAGVTAGNAKAIWRSDNGGTPVLLLRTGDSMTTSKGDKIVANIDMPGTTMDIRPWELPVMDNNGRVLMVITFTDGTTSQVIAPGSTASAPAPCPTITVISPPPAGTGDPYDLTAVATGGTAPYTWSATNLPTGLSITPAGVISGTPTTNGTATITATDANGCTGTTTLTSAPPLN